MSVITGSRFKRSAEERLNRAVKHVENFRRGFSLIKKGTEWAPENEGDYEISIMPYLVTKPNHPDLRDYDYTPGEEYFYRRPYGVHRLNNKPYICPNVTFGEACPICEERKKYEKGTPEAKLFSVERWVLYAIKVKNMSDYFVFNWKYTKFTKNFDEALEMEDDKSNLIFFEFQGGKNIRFKVRTNKDGKYHYLEAKGFKFSDRKDLPENIVDEVPQLDECIEALSYEKLKSILIGSIDSILENEEAVTETTEDVEDVAVSKPTAKKNTLPPRKFEQKDDDFDSTPATPVDEFDDVPVEDDDFDSETPADTEDDW